MNRLRVLKSVLVGGASAVALASPVAAKLYDIPRGDLVVALDTYMLQSGVQIAYLDDAVRGRRSQGASGNLGEYAALTEILNGTGLTYARDSSGIVTIVPKPVEVAQAGPPKPKARGSAGVETVVVTAEKKSEDIQTVPIAVTAFTQKDLKERQIATGGDLIRDTPNMNFSKTNFSGYSIELRGIGTQAISVTTDPAVAVAFNGIPFIRNHFFEQEFYDLGDLEVLRGPQGTLYGRNATAGVVNIVSAKPTDSYEAELSADFGSYNNRRLEGMLNIPIVGDKLDLRLAAEWTKRDGYSFNTITNQPIDGRDLWSGRASLRWQPISDLDINAVWEHFSESDDRMRTAKQLCHTDPIPTEVDGQPVDIGTAVPAYTPGHYLSQGCRPASLYSSASFEVPNGLSLPYYSPLSSVGAPITGEFGQFDPYASTTQSRNLREIETQLNPIYRAKNDTIELNVEYTVSPTLNLSSQTGYNQDFLWSTEDYNRFNTAPGAFIYQLPVALGGNGRFNNNNSLGTLTPDPNGLGRCVGNGGSDATCSGLAQFASCTPQAGAYTDPDAVSHFACIPAGVFCDPQLGCSDRLVAQDLSEERSWQFSQEFRLASHFDGPLNFSLGGNYLHYETQENYYVFLNVLTLATYGWAGNGQTLPYVPGSPSSNTNCLVGGLQVSNPFSANQLQNEGGSDCQYIDPNPLGSLNNQGHNYFLSQNPYNLNSYAMFGEAYYNLTDDLKLTGGLRWTEDQKHFTLIPSELLVPGYGYPKTGVVDQQWDAITGRAVANWTPKLNFTDQTLVYLSYSHGYKAGGANPPGARLLTFGSNSGQTASPIHPLTFKPEYIDAYELGTKNTLLDGTLTLNADVFFYDYKHYQISRIVDRTAINDNFDATVKGAELESTWEPTPGLKFNLAAGLEDTRVADGQSSIDLIDRTAGNPGWMVVKPFVTQASNCILPTYVVAAAIDQQNAGPAALPFACTFAYSLGFDPVTELPYVPNPTVDKNGSPIQMAGYPGFDPSTAPNKGEGFAKNLSGNKLPNSPPFTLSVGAQYTIPAWTDWTATLRGDFYWQGNSFARIFNDKPYDQLHGYTNLNLALILNSAEGWQAMGYIKNVFNTTALTGDFLNSDDSGLTTNVFLTDPRLFGVRITKHLDEDNGFWGNEWSGADWVKDVFEDADNGKPVLWIEMGSGLDQLDAPEVRFVPSFVLATPRPTPEKISPLSVERQPRFSFSEEAKVSFEPHDSDWIVSVGIRYGRTSDHHRLHQQSYPTHGLTSAYGSPERKVLQFSDGEHRTSETYAIFDFMAGKDVGLGMFGTGSSSLLNLGLRFAQFSASSNTTFSSDPDAHPTFKYGAGNKFLTGGVYHVNAAALESKRSFHGVGPLIAWNSSDPVLGSPDDGQVKFDWGLNAALLFGRQRTRVHHHTTAQYHQGKYNSGYNNAFRTTLSTASVTQTRSRMVVVPNLGGFAGLSMNYRNAKISFGYRADYFFAAMDGGIDQRRRENIGFFGPFAKLSLGLGG